jgi:hypothetical protein
VQASVQAVETRPVSTAGAAPAADTSEASDLHRTGGGDTASPRRLSQRAIELIGIAFGIAVIAAVALGARLSNDEFWQLAAGQWMLAHHSIMGLDPFSYTEAHRRWVTDEWGSEVALAGLVKVFGNAAYALYAIVLGGLSLFATAAYARSLGARGGRVALIVLVLAAGIAGELSGDRGLDFSLVFLPFELLVLSKARTNPRWLWCLPPLCVLWVNTHGSILIGLVVLAVELGWSLAPEQFVARIGGVRQSPHTGPLALALLGSVVASCVTPYGPSLLVYDLGVSQNSQISLYVQEWNSPNFHSFGMLLCYVVPIAVLGLAVRTRRVPVLEGTLAVALLLEALRSQRLAIYLMVIAAGLAATLPQLPAWSTRARRVAALCYAVFAIAILAVPSVPAGSVAPGLPVQAFNYLEHHPGRVFTEYTWGDYSIARQRATFVDGRTDLFEGEVLTEFMALGDLTVNPDTVLSQYRVSYVVWTPNSGLSTFLEHDRRWHVVDRSSTAWVFARR